MSARWDAVWAALDGWERLALVALMVGAFAQTLFVIIYGTRRWWLVRPGRATFLKALALATILDLTVVNTFLTYDWQERVTAVAIVFIAVTIVYQLVALLLSPRHPNA